MTDTIKISRDCPLCDGTVQFHRDEECSGCHLLCCQRCLTTFDLSHGVDANNECATLYDLQLRIADAWNRRATPPADAADMGGQAGEEVETWKQMLREQQELYADAMVAIGNALGIDVSDEPRCKHVAAEAAGLRSELAKWKSLAQDTARIAEIAESGHKRREEQHRQQAGKLAEALRKLTAAMACHDSTPEEYNALAGAREALADWEKTSCGK